MREGDLIPRLREHLPSSVRDVVDAAAAAARARRKSLYLVGGVVRDLLLGRPSVDIDLVIEGNAVSLAKVLAGDSRLTVHTAFGTATLKRNGSTLDFVTARKETYSHPGALPDVCPSSIEDDLYRRDFTINAMAIALTGKSRGMLVDPWGGHEDLSKGLIRVLHDGSFTDDATRILRAIRYEQRLGFDLESGTEFLLKRDVPRLETISGDRIRHELERIFEEACPERVINRGSRLGVWQGIHPSLPSKREDRWLIEAFQRARDELRPTPPALYLALFLYRLEEDEATAVLNRLSMPKALTRIVLDTVTLKQGIGTLGSGGLKPSKLYNDLRDFSTVSVVANIIGTDSEGAAENLRTYMDKLRFIRPSLRGDDLVRMGASPGPGLGALVSRLHQAKLDGEVNSKAEEVKFAHLLLASRRPVITRARRRKG